MALLVGCLMIVYFAASHRGRRYNNNNDLEASSQHFGPQPITVPTPVIPGEAQHQGSGVETDPLAKLRTMIEDGKEWDTVLTQDLSLTQSARELLYLTEEEAARLKATLETYKREIKDAEIGRMEVSEVSQNDTSTIIILQPATNGESVRRNFEEVITDQLGEERASLFLKAAWQSLWIGSGDLGRITRTISVKPESGGWKLTVLAVEGVIGAEQPTRKVISTTSRVTDVPEYLNHLMSRE